MTACKIELGISPLSANETDRALLAIRRIWCQPAWIKRHACGNAWLLAISHEAEIRPEESLDWFAERLVAAIWQAIGRYAWITLDFSGEDEHRFFEFSEVDYRRILRDFRLSPNIYRHQ